MGSGLSWEKELDLGKTHSERAMRCAVELEPQIQRPITQRFCFEEKACQS